MLKRTILPIVALVFGVLVLLGTLLPLAVQADVGIIRLLANIRVILVGWASVLGVFALLMAYFGIWQVHISRIRHSSQNRVTSLLVFLASVGSLGLVLWQGPHGEWPRYLLTHVLVPGESALLALTAVTLTLAGMRVFRTRREAGSLVFVLVTLLMLFTAVPFIYPPLVQKIVDLVNVMAVSGMRGVLIGVALGTTLTAIRILLAMDRPYSDE